MNSFDAQLAGFLDTLRVRNLAPATLTSRRQALGVLSRFLRERGILDAREVTREHARRFALALANRGYSDHTRQAYLGAARAFFAHLARAAVMLANPCADLALPRTGRRLPRGVLSPEQARRILDAPGTRRLAGLRDKAIIETFYSTGLRLGELARLTVLDVNHDHGFVRVNHGKGGRDRVVPIGRKACRSIRNYLSRVRGVWVGADRDQCALWLSSRRPHSQLKAQMIAVVVKRSGRAAGCHVTPHVWRHTCATHLVARGANLAAVQRQLGHASLRTTQLYTRVSVPDLIEMHRRAHPRNRALTP